MHATEPSAAAESREIRKVESVHFQLGMYSLTVHLFKSSRGFVSVWNIFLQYADALIDALHSSVL